MSTSVAMLSARARPEAVLLLAGARTSVDAAAAQRIRELLASELNWDDLIETASLHNTLPLVYRSLHGVAPELVPPAAMDTFRHKTRTIAQANLLLTGELLKLLDLFEVHEIPAIPFKGPVLATLAYGSLTLRPFGDLDILISRRDFGRARNLLLAMGYQSSLTPDSVAEAVFLQKHHDYLFEQDDGRFSVDVQWGIIQEPFTFPLDVEHLWRRREPVAIANRQVPSLPVEELILILCVHGAKHLWERLIWICDIAELLHMHPTLDWDRVLDKARTMGARRMLLLGLFLAHSLLDAPLPQPIVCAARAEPVVRSLALQVCEGLLREPDMLSTTYEDAPMFYIRMMERWQDRLRLCLRFSPSLLRPRALLKRYGLRPLRHMIGY